MRIGAALSTDPDPANAAAEAAEEARSRLGEAETSLAVLGPPGRAPSGRAQSFGAAHTFASQPHRKGRMDRAIGIIGAPSSAGAFSPGQEKAPEALRRAGLVDRLRDADLVVVDHGDIPAWRWRPDPGRPRAQNVGDVVTSALNVAERVRTVLAAGEVALVLGGDCTVGLGTVAGHLPNDKTLGLVYFDLHPDLNVPDSVPEGALDWMGVAHMLGEDQAVPELREFGPRQPLLDNDQLLLFAYGREHATPWELEVIQRRSLQTVPLEEVAAHPEAAAAAALQRAEIGWDKLLIHFDVDTVDFTDAPLSENTGRNSGLSLHAALLALGTLVQSSRLSALTITELNPDHGAEDGSTIDRFVEGLVGCLAGVPASA